MKFTLIRWLLPALVSPFLQAQTPQLSGSFDPFPAEKVKNWGLSEATRYLVGCDPGIFAAGSNRLIVGEQETHLAFNRAGHKLEEIIFADAEGRRIPRHHSTWNYNNAGQVTSQRYEYLLYRRTDFNAEDSSYVVQFDTLLRASQFQYHSSGQRRTELVYAGRNSAFSPQPTDSIAWIWGPYGDVSSRQYYHELPGHRSGARLLLTQTLRYEWDKQGQVKKELRMEDGDVYGEREWTYDELGRCTRERQSDFSGRLLFERRYTFSRNQMRMDETVFNIDGSVSLTREEIWFFEESGLPLGYTERSGDGAEPVCYLFRYQFH